MGESDFTTDVNVTEKKFSKKIKISFDTCDFPDRYDCCLRVLQCNGNAAGRREYYNYSLQSYFIFV